MFVSRQTGFRVALSLLAGFSLAIFSGCGRRAERAAEYLRQGMASAEEGRFLDALAYYDSALAVNPRFEDALVKKGDALASMMRLSAALETYERALALNGRNVRAQLGKAYVLTRLESPVEAREAFERALAVAERPDSVLAVRGWAEYDAHREDDARESFRLATEMNPQNKDAWVAIALLAMRTRLSNPIMMAERALPAINRALEIDPKDRTVWTLKRVVLRGVGRFDEELAVCDTLLALTPRDSAGWHTFRSDFRVQLGRATVWVTRAAALTSLGRYEESLSSFDSSLAYDPSDYHVWRFKASALNKLGRRDEAQACYEEANRREMIQARQGWE